MRGERITHSYGFHLCQSWAFAPKIAKIEGAAPIRAGPGEKKTPPFVPRLPSLFFFLPFPQHHPLSYCASSTHPLLVDTLLRFESLRVAGVLDFCHWESAASVLALRLSSGTLEISLQPNARALVLKSSRSSDVTAQAYPQLAQSGQTLR